MNGPSLLVALADRPVSYPVAERSVMRRRSVRIGRTGGDGAPHHGHAEGLRLVVAGPPRSEDDAWRTRVEAAQAEARAALRVPFNRPVTWEPG